MVTKNEQMELPIPPRARVRLETPPEMTHVLPGTCTVPLATLVADKDLERTPWETKEDPPCPGWWEVTDHKTGALLARWWFGGVWWVKGDPGNARTDRLSSDQFKTQYAWRGLRAPSPEPYGPPYNSLLIMQRARDFGVALRTRYMRIAAGSGAIEKCGPSDGDGPEKAPDVRRRVTL